MFESFFRTKYRLKLMKKTAVGVNPDGTPRYIYDEVATAIIDPLLTQTVYKGKPFEYHLNEVSHRKGNKAFIFKDIDDGQTVMKLGCDDYHKEFGVSYKAKVQIAKDALQGNQQNYGLLVVALAGGVCLMIGLVIGMYLPNILGGVA